VAQFAVHPPREDPQPDPDLGGGEAGAGSLPHGVGEVRDEAGEFLVEVHDDVGGGAQDRVTEQANVLDGHRRILFTAGLRDGPVAGRAGDPQRRAEPSVYVSRCR
jgi:hypothetical protein